VDWERYKSIPNGPLAIATFLHHKGHDVKIIDARPLPKETTLKLVEDSLSGTDLVCVGANTVQLKHGIILSDHIKRINRDVPILFGGIHAIMYPSQTVADKSIDYVVHGEAEYTILELIEYLEKKDKRLEDIKGLAFKQNGKIIITPAAPGIDPNELPLPDYSLLEDVEKYINREFSTNLGKIRKMRGLDIHTSRGCPYRCTFCPMTMPEFRGYRNLRLEKVFELIDIAVQKYNVGHIWFSDELFFSNKLKVKRIARHIIDKGYKITWESNARVEQFRESLLDDETLRVMKESGCYALRMGMESGSNRVLNLMKKDSCVDNTIHAVRQCEKYGIIPVGNFICGFPTETKEEVLDTAKLILTLKEISPNGLFFSPGLLRPYPGTEMYELCKRYGGYEEPQTLREWANRKIDVGLFANPTDLKWVKYPTWLRNFQVYFYIITVLKTHEKTGTKLSPTWKFFAKLAVKRLYSNFWGVAFEPPLLIHVKNFLDKKSKIAEFLKSTLRLDLSQI